MDGSIMVGLAFSQLVIFLLMCPYTKVEESFNVQAMHDILFHNGNLTEYDHKQFPGVVPRTFIGPLIISLFTYPAVFLSQFIPDVSKSYIFMLCRLVLGGLVFKALLDFNSTLKKMFGSLLSCYFLAITTSQFHFLFYASRPLPNIFALIPTLCALSAWLEGKHVKFIGFSAFATIVFRFELCILFGVCLLHSLLSGRLCLRKSIPTILTSGFSIIVATVAVDTLFWGRPIWPEYDVMFYNVILNKSSNWGTSPYYWYITSALPRCLLSAFFLVPLGLLTDFKRCILFFLPAVSFIAAFSFLPHKELRFVIYTIPLFNTIAARGFVSLHRIRNKSFWHRCIHAGSICLLLLNFLLSTVFLLASNVNYPGGKIFSSMHERIACNPENPVTVHISNLAAQTGVSRFGEDCPHWRYLKTENLSFEDIVNDSELTHVIADYDEANMKKWEENFLLIDREDSFTGKFEFPYLFNKDIPIFMPTRIMPRAVVKPALALWKRLQPMVDP